MMTFGAGKILWLLALAIPLTWVMRLAWARASARMKSFGQAGQSPRDHVRSRVRRERVATLLAMAGIVFALAGPRGGFDEVEVQSSGSDIFVAFDLSNSMMASDVRPSRYERARREVFDLVDHVADSGRADRIGLVGFAGVSFVQCPLTADMNALREYLMLMSPGDMPVQGTDIGGAIKTALAAMEAGGVGPGAETSTQAIILISDGENLEGDADDAVKMAKERGVRIFTVGVGTADGAPVPDMRGGLKKDARGNVVVSKFSGKTLQEIAAETGGEYVELASTGRVQSMEFVSILGESVRESGKMKLWHEKFQWPLAVSLLAVAFLGASTLRGSVILLVIGLTGFMAGGMAAPRAWAAGAGPMARRERLRTFNDGVDAAEAGDFAKARELFDKAAELGKRPEKASDTDSEEVRARSLYNSGTAAIGAGDLDAAEKAYEEALKVKPDDKETAENLAWVREQKKQQQQQEKKQDQQQNQQQQNNDGQQGRDQDNQDQENQDQKNQNEAKQKQDQNQDQKQAAKQPQKSEPRELSREEAKRLLNSVDDLKPKYMYFVLPKDQQEKSNTPPEKDW